MRARPCAGRRVLGVQGLKANVFTYPPHSGFFSSFDAQFALTYKTKQQSIADIPPTMTNFVLYGDSSFSSDNEGNSI